jgi:sulfite exporter TauE/SafE
MDPTLLAYAGTMLITGALGSLGHCLGMCGPLVAMIGLQLPRSGLQAVPRHLVYHAARISVYALLGALSGGAGAFLGMRTGLMGASGWVSLALGAAVIVFGLAYLHWLPARWMGAATPWLRRAMGRALRWRNWGGLAVLGALNGLLPCGLVYTALLLAAASGSAARGALGMALFGSATLPLLLVLGAGAAAVSVNVRRRMAQLGGAFVVLVGLQLVLRGSAGLGVLSHHMLGGLMLW